MANLGIVRARVKQMVAADAPDEDIEAYIASEGTTVDEVRNFKSAPISKEAMAFDPDIKGGYLSESYNPETGYVEPSKTQSFIEGAGNNITLGFGDEIMALPISMAKGQTYEDTLKKINQQQDDAKFHNPKSYLGGQVAGSIAQGVALAPLSATARGYQAGAGMTKLMGLSGLDAAVLGGAAGLGEGEGLEDRLKKGAKGAVIGGATGLVSPLATSLLGTGYQGVKGFFGAGNLERAKNAIAQTLLRSGKPAQDVVGDITQAGTEGQGMYALADALGYEGQRRLSGVTRIPGPQRNKVVDTLNARQDDQASRVIDTLKEGMGTQQGTALKKAAADTATRRFDANVNYPAARQASGAVDTSAAIQQLDDILTPGMTGTIGAGAADDSVFGTLAKARGYLTDGKSQVSDFDRALRAKIEMDAIIEKGGTAAARLKPARDALDDALAKSSPPYANARDTYRLQSEGIEAIEQGGDAAKGGLTADTTSLFGGMGPHQQPGFRQGYVDRLIEKAERAGEGANVARPLTSLKRKVELPAFAAPGQGDKMVRKIGRENEMFKTREQAIGGSATAQNLADNADTADAGMLFNLATGNFKAAAAQGAAKIIAGSQGLNETTRGFMADMLMETDPVVVQGLLKAAQKSGKDAVAARALLNMMFNQAAPKAAAPFVEPMLPQ